MNEIEEKFYEAFLNNEYSDYSIDRESIIPQKSIGIYVVDFLVNNFVIEIDGHDSHKTKEQREKDSKKDRYLMRHGYIVIRFTASEVFVDVESCIRDVYSIFESFNIRENLAVGHVVLHELNMANIVDIVSAYGENND